MKTNVLWITRTAMFTALLVVMQAATVSFGNTLITGSIVNLILVVSVMTCGLASGLTVAFLSPICAKLIGIGPLWALTPFIIAGNISLVLVWHYVGNSRLGKGIVTYAAAVISGAVVKFLVLYISIAKFAVPILLQLPEPQATVISNTFSIPQLFTALVGGTLAAAILPAVKKAIKA